MLRWLVRMRDVVTVAAVTAPVVYLAAHWNEFPATIPIHFGATGMPDGWGPRWTLILLPIVGLGVVSMLATASRFPRLFNYPVRVTDENRARQQALAIRLLDDLRVQMALMLGYLGVQQMRVSLGFATGLGLWFLPVVLGTIGVTIGVYMWSAIRAR